MTTITIVGKDIAGWVLCLSCGHINTPTEARHVKKTNSVVLEYIPPACRNCGEVENLSACREPEDSCAYHANLNCVHGACTFDHINGRHTVASKTHVYLDKAVTSGKWVVTARIRTAGLEIDLNDKFDAGQWLITLDSGCYKFFKVIEPNQQAVAKVRNELQDILKAGENRSKKDFFASLRGKQAVCLDIPKGSARNHYHSMTSFLEEEGWLSWDGDHARRVCRWFKASHQGVIELIKLLDGTVGAKGQVFTRSFSCVLNGITSTLYVESGTEGRWIGKGGEKIKMLSNAWGRRIQVRAMQEHTDVRYKISRRYIDGGMRPTLEIVPMKIYTCGDIELDRELSVDFASEGATVLSKWLATQGFKEEGVYPWSLGEEFPKHYCMAYESPPKEPWDDNPTRQCIRKGKKFSGLTVKEWYQLFFDGKAWEEFE